jgi:hypothetical protein
MMCMECSCNFVQQTSTARDTLAFCSARCEFTHTFPMASGSPQTLHVVQALGDRICDRLEMHG